MTDLPLPLVSVICPCHNKASTIIRAMSSVAQQTLSNLECIVVNDSSDDDSEELILGAVGGDARFRYEAVQYRNVAKVRNFGASKAKGLFFCFLDGDDWIEDVYLETCVKALLNDQSLGIAYTSLRWHKPDGSTGISEWPGEWNFDEQLRRKNQVSTCSVMRRECWERLGGQRARYCSTLGAGSEDAEFHLRAGAYGWRAEKVTEEPLFNYSWMSGLVTGDPNYNEPDWLGWHSWVNDHQHPFASYATPKNGLSHPVRQMDEPQISVVIPVGPDHLRLVWNALDSLEAQTFRKWEVILVDDTGPSTSDEMIEDWMRLSEAYPYVQAADTSGPHGAGYARNMGAEIARAPFLLFLDADDWLYPECLERMVAAWNEHQAIAYTDYVGKAIVSPSDLAEDLQSRLYTFNERTGEAVIGYKAFDYDCELAQAQPQGDRPYIWTNVTSLIPRAWHDGVGGFDESLSSWEDVDYHWRLAKAGHCYHRIAAELMVYNFHYGHRRERGRQTYQSLLDYLRDKHKEVEPMGCSGCGGRRARARQATRVQGAPQSQASAVVDDSEFVQVRYMGKGGRHQVTGVALLDAPIPGWNMLRRSKEPPLWSIRYGGRSRGETFLVHRDDVAQQPGLFVPVETEHIVSAPQVERVVEPPKPLMGDVGVEEVEVVQVDPPEEPSGPPADVPSAGIAQGVVDGILSPGRAQQQPGSQPSQPPLPSPLPMGGRHATFDLQTLPGIGAKIAKQLQADGIDSKDKVVALGEQGLQRYQGISEAKARVIIAALEG